MLSNVLSLNGVTRNCLEIPTENNLSALSPIAERRMADAGLRTALLETIAGLMATDQVASAAIGSNSFSKGKLVVPTSHKWTTRGQN